MLIQCENCRTIFRLDEARLKKGGSRVRCSRCGSLFMAYPPVVPREDTGRTSTAIPKPDREDRASDLISMDVDHGPAQPMGKDEAFEADLESVYKTALAPPRPDLEQETESLLEKRDWDEEPEEEPQEAKGALERDMEPTEPVRPRKEPSRSGLRTVLLALLLILVAGVAGVAYLRPAWIAPYLALLKAPEKPEPSPPDPGVRLLQFESVAGSFVDSAKGGQLFVVRGMVRSRYPHPRSHILVKGSILDDEGKVVESRVSYAGNAFTEEELKTLPVEEILKAMQNRDGMARQNVNVRPEAAIPFTIIFQNLSNNMSEFAVEAVSSSPGT